jgi:lysozyme
MTASQDCLDLIKEFEGWRANPYLCPAGFWTIGFGCRFYSDGKPVRKADGVITKNEGEVMLASCLTAYEAAVEDAVTTELNQHQFDALVCFTYNCGIRAFCKSTLLKKVNVNPNNPLIRNEYMRWVKAGKTTLKGLVRRRKAEADLYFKKVKPTSAISI